MIAAMITPAAVINAALIVVFIAIDCSPVSNSPLKVDGDSGGGSGPDKCRVEQSGPTATQNIYPFRKAVYTHRKNSHGPAVPNKVPLSLTLEYRGVVET